MISIEIQTIVEEDPTDWIVHVNVGAYRAYDVYIPNRNKYSNLNRSRAWHHSITIYAYLPNWNGNGHYNKQISATCSPTEMTDWLRYSLGLYQDGVSEVFDILTKGGWRDDKAWE